MRKLVLSVALLVGAQISMAQTLSPELIWRFGRVSEPQVSPDGKIVLFGITNYDVKENKGSRDLYIVSTAGGDIKKITQHPKSESNGIWRPDGRRVAYIVSENGTSQVWEMDPDGNNKKQLTNLRSDVSGFKYSPDMKSVVVFMDVKIDKDVLDIYPDLDKTDGKIIDNLMYRHWDEWEDGYYSHIFVAPYMDGAVGQFEDIMPGEHFDAPTKPFGGIEQVNFSPDGKLIAYTSKKVYGTAAAQSTNTDIYLYDLDTKKTTNITSANKGYDVNPSFSPTEKKIAYLSMATPQYEADRNRIMIYDLNTPGATELTEGLDQSANEIVWAKDGKSIIFNSDVQGAEQLYSLDLASKKLKTITKGLQNLFAIDNTAKEIIGIRTTMTQPAEVVKVSMSGSITPLTKVNDGFISKLQFGKMEEKVFTTADKKKLHVNVVFPPNFDPNKKYPTLVYCQGGPQSAISQSFSYRWNFQLMAAQGYIVVAPQRRGVPGFGQAWEDEIAGNWGSLPIDDYLTATDSMAVMPYVDAQRMGAVGASYGGYSVYQLAGVHNKRFKVFIAHCGLFDMRSWYLTTEEHFFAQHDLGKPYWKDAKNKTFSTFNPANFVARWNTPILVIHNQKDYRVPVEQGMAAFQAAQLRGVPSRFLYIPDEGHWVTKPQNSLLWNRVFFEWLDKYLKPNSK